MRSTSHRVLAAAGFATALALVPFAQAGAQEAGAQSGRMQSSNETVPGKADDAWITTKVKSEFATTKNVPASDISVSTSDGVVTLSGNVATHQQKMNAERVARTVKGVKSVDATGLTIHASSADQPSSSGQ